VTASCRGIAPRFRHQILLPWTAELAPFYEGSTRFGDDRLQRTYGAGAGWHYLIRRFHDPATGQFLSVDPQVATTMDSYRYADEDPVNADDPTGQSVNLAGTAAWAVQNLHRD
jgi:RHS repeat-associated protein